MNRPRKRGNSRQGFAHNADDRRSRRDETHTLSLSVHNRAFILAGFFNPRFSLVREERDTNAQALDTRETAPSSPSCDSSEAARRKQEDRAASGMHGDAPSL